ncbi:MAG: TolC family outer membrane protein [Arenicellales bacterium]
MHKQFKRLAKQFTTTLFAIGFIASAQHAAAEDLLDVYKLALQNDAVYLAAADEYEARKLNLPLAKSNFRPFISASGDLGRTRSDVTGTDITSDNNQLRLDLDLPLFDRVQSIGIDQAELEVENARIQFEIAHDDLTLRLAESYFSLLGFQDAREVARRQRIAIKRQMDLAAERLDVGLGTRTDLFDARARFQQADSDVITADIEINNALQALIEIINVTPETVEKLSDDAPLEFPEPNELSSWVDRSKTNNLRVVAAGTELLVASQEIDRQRAVRIPTVSLGASQRYTDNTATSISDGNDSSTAVALSLNLPLYLGGTINLRTKQAGLQYNAFEQALDLAKRRAVSDTTVAFRAITSGISRVNALAEAVIAGENALQAKEEGFSAGLTTNIDVLDAQRDLTRSSTDYLRAKYNYILSLLDLEQAVGDLGEEDILRINEWLTE